MARKKRNHSLAGLPLWARKLAQQYYTRTVSTFIVYGAVHDLQPVTQPNAEQSYSNIKQFFLEELFGSREHVVFYDRSSGIRGARPETQLDFLKEYNATYGADVSKAVPKDASRALQILEGYLRSRLAEGKSIALVIDFAEAIAPAGDIGHLSAEDRFSIVTLVKWASDVQFLSNDLSIVLLVENLADISPKLSRNPYVANIELALPTEDERIAFIRWKLKDTKLQSVTNLSFHALAQMTSGLSRINLDRLFTEALDEGVRVTSEVLKAKKKEIIHAECHGLLEFIEPEYTLDAVAGHEKVKNMLRAAAAALRVRIEVMPMGYLVSGPVGTGKTFLVTCFAGEIGIPCVKFLNFRSQWQGVTEANLEKIFNLLKALWPVAVMVDEADAFLGTRNAAGDSGTSNRIFAAIAGFMGNTQYRGKIVWFLMTCRPDLLPIDIKRQGRAEEHIALFYPQSQAEQDELFSTMQKKTKVHVKAPRFSKLAAHGHAYSGADIEAVLVRAQFRAIAHGRAKVTSMDVEEAMRDFVPPSYPLELELQNLVAVQECTSRSLLPKEFQRLKRDDITRRVKELKALLDD